MCEFKIDLSHLDSYRFMYEYEYLCTINYNTRHDKTCDRLSTEIHCLIVMLMHSSTSTGVATATDNCDPASSIVIAQRDSIVSGSCANSKLIYSIWTATDSCLNMSSCVQLITNSRHNKTCDQFVQRDTLL
jgi:hypothetical protein